MGYKSRLLEAMYNVAVEELKEVGQFNPFYMAIDQHNGMHRIAMSKCAKFLYSEGFEETAHVRIRAVGLAVDIRLRTDAADKSVPLGVINVELADVRGENVEYLRPYNRDEHGGFGYGKIIVREVDDDDDDALGPFWDIIDQQLKMAA